MCVGCLRMMSSCVQTKKNQTRTKGCGAKCEEEEAQKKQKKKDGYIARSKRNEIKEGFGGDAKWLSFKIGCAVPFVSSRLLPCVSGRGWCASGSR